VEGLLAGAKAKARVKTVEVIPRLKTEFLRKKFLKRVH
jgi:hypothetical protein